jgi:uncharacterized protein YlaN (UPF0358 family)
VDPVVSLRRRALRLLREQYETIAAAQQVRLDSVNSARPPALRYRSREDLIQEWRERADAVSAFAVRLGLITPEEAKKAILAFYARHPEMRHRDE